MRTAGPGAVGRDECEPIQCTDNACQHGGLCVPMGMYLILLKVSVYFYMYEAVKSLRPRGQWIELC
jgi:hypothetical protein